MEIDPSEVAAIVQWRLLLFVTEVRSFGAVQYVRKFIANSSYTASPLHSLTSRKQMFRWGGEKTKSFRDFERKD